MKYSASLCLVLLIVGLPLYTLAACGDKIKIQDIHDRSWVKSHKTIIFKDGGKIYKTQFNSNDSTLLAEHQFEYLQGDLSMSPDARFVINYGFSKDKDDYSAYIFDLKLAKEFRMPINLPRHASGVPLSTPHFVFSPNSKMVAWQEDQSFIGGHDVVIMNLMDRTSTRVPFPTTNPFPTEAKVASYYGDEKLEWALDGKSVYLGSIAYPSGVYYQYDIVSKKINRVDGRYHSVHNDWDSKDVADAGLHFIVNGKEARLFKQPCLQSRCSEQGKAISGETATIDKDYQLILKTPDGKKTVVDKGEYSQCAGVTIRILSWLENGKYLIYEMNGVPYIYGVKEARKATLLLGSFGWSDNENRKSTDPY